MKFRILAVLLCTCFSTAIHAQITSKIELWKRPSYFRGFVLSPNIPISQQDVWDVKSFGATIVVLETDGFWGPDTPYSIAQENIDSLDDRAHYCDVAGMYYTIAVRQGPGRNDVVFEGGGSAPPSTIWKNPIQQQMYGSMLRTMTSRYSSDTFCVGITPTVEPDPFYDSLCCIDTAMFGTYFRRNNVNFPAITQLWVDSIRSASSDIPILIQGPGYTNPTVFSLVPVIPDPNIVYEFHNYHPVEYSEAADTAQVVYPGPYLDAINGTIEFPEYNRTFIEDTLFEQVTQVATRTNAPIFLGEFGMTYPHTGGPQYLADVSSIAIEKGWNFAYFDYWHRPNGQGAWDYKDWGSNYWSNILASLVQGTNIVNSEPEPSSAIVIVLNGNQLDIDAKGDGNTSEVHGAIYDLIGRNILSFDRFGTHFTVPLDNLNSGGYFLVLRFGANVATKFFSIAP